MKKANKRYSVGPMSRKLLPKLTRWLTGSKIKPLASIDFSPLSALARRKTALMRETNSRVENGLVM